MTLGWHIGDNDKVRYFYKEGGGAGYHSEMRIYPDQGLASVFMVHPEILLLLRLSIDSLIRPTRL